MALGLSTMCFSTAWTLLGLLGASWELLSTQNCKPQKEYISTVFDGLRYSSGMGIKAGIKLNSFALAARQFGVAMDELVLTLY